MVDLAGREFLNAWNGHFSDSEKDVPEAEICRKIPEVLRRARFSLQNFSCGGNQSTPRS